MAASRPNLLTDLDSRTGRQLGIPLSCAAAYLARESILAASCKRSSAQLCRPRTSRNGGPRYGNYRAAPGDVHYPKAKDRITNPQTGSGGERTAAIFRD